MKNVDKYKRNKTMVWHLIALLVFIGYIAHEIPKDSKPKNHIDYPANSDTVYVKGSAEVHTYPSNQLL